VPIRLAGRADDDFQVRTQADLAETATSTTEMILCCRRPSRTLDAGKPHCYHPPNIERNP